MHYSVERCRTRGRRVRVLTFILSPSIHPRCPRCQRNSKWGRGHEASPTDVQSQRVRVRVVVGEMVTTIPANLSRPSVSVLEGGLFRVSLFLTLMLLYIGQNLCENISTFRVGSYEPNLKHQPI